MTTVHSYLTFNDNCEEAFLFYQSVFGGEFSDIGRYNEMPSDEPINEEESEKIMHVSLPIGNTMLMGSDSVESCGGSVKIGSNISISVNTDSEEEATRIFNALSRGGNVTMPLGKTFWNAFFGMFTDKFGINWMVNYDYGKDKLN